MPFRVWKSKEQRLNDEADRMLSNVQRFVILHDAIGGLDPEDREWVDRQISSAQTLRDKSRGARYNLTDLVEDILVPCFILVGPLTLVYFTIGRFCISLYFPHSVGAWWVFPLYLPVASLAAILSLEAMLLFDRWFLEPQRLAQLAAMRAALQLMDATYNAAVKRIETD